MTPEDLLLWAFRAFNVAWVLASLWVLLNMG